MNHAYEPCGPIDARPWHARHRRRLLMGMATLVVCALTVLTVCLVVLHHDGGLHTHDSTGDVVTFAPPAPGAGGGATSGGKPGSNGSRVPNSPKHAKLTTYTPCSSRTNASLPMLVNDAWLQGNATMTSAYVVQHGHLSNLDRYYEIAYPLVGQDAVLIAPGLYHTSSSAAPKTWYEPSHTMAWLTEDSWSAGYDAVLTASKRHGGDDTHAVPCAPFDAYDAILTRLADKTLYPRLTNVYFVGHSGGARLISRYAQLSDELRHASLHIRYVVMNAPNQAYFGRARPWPAALHTCPAALEYPYQMTNFDDQMPRYVKQRFVAMGTTPTQSSDTDDADKSLAVLKRWLARNVVMLVGDHDVLKQPDETCGSVAQGGPARRDRNYAYWAYENMLAGTKIDVSQYSGYANLTDSLEAPKSINVGADFKHQMCVVTSIGHEALGMFNSLCCHGALFDATLPPGAGPSFPPDAKTPDDYERPTRFQNVVELDD